MIQSMTGYGKAEAQLPGGKLTVEIRTLNGKSADINLKSPLLPKEKDLAVRKLLADRLIRGTIDLYLTYEPNEGEAARPINADAVRAYFSQVTDLRRSLPGFTTAHEGDAELLAAILRLPDVTDTRKADVIDDSSWPLVESAIGKALDALCAYRAQEGRALYTDVTSRVAGILALYDQVEALEGERITAVRERLQKALEDLSAKVDPSRFEQELIFYLEKYDINEEKVRLRQHCKYFMEVIDSEPYPGKKLGFIIQEMGREINTTGSKANHAGIQQLVVRMKDELEKIREQSMNIL
ncbi:MAG: YicC family protein [Bacteroidales bacterium]|nr:YicC family protein [Bacteroidales bacterium]